jgi:hypothetical protein
MSAAGVAKAKEDTCARGAKPRPEGRVREHRWPPTTSQAEFALCVKEAARRRASPQEADTRPLATHRPYEEAEG